MSDCLFMAVQAALIFRSYFAVATFPNFEIASTEGLLNGLKYDIFRGSKGKYHYTVVNLLKKFRYGRC